MGAWGRSRRSALAIVAAAASAIALLVYLTEALDRSELDTVDARFALRGELEPPDDLAVVAIDDVSFNELDERWPFPRSLHGELIDVLSAAGAAAIVYDVQFTEPTEPREDNALITAVAESRAPVVLATEEVNREGESNIFGGEEVLREIGARAGNSAFDPDPGGVYRRLRYATRGLESLAVAAVEERDGVTVGSEQFPDDGAWVDFHGPPETLPTYSFSEVLSGEVDPSEFDGRTVVVGVSAPSVQDVHPVPTSDNQLMSGAEIQANAVETVTRDLPLHEAPKPLGALIVIAMGTIVPATAIRLRPLAAAAIGLLATAGYLLLAQLAFNGGAILPVIDPLLAMVLAIVGTLAVLYMLAAFERQRVRDTFARFVPADVVGEVLERTDEDLRLGGSRREATVMFVDLRSFTGFAEAHAPEQVVEVLNRYLGEMTDAIMDHGGTLVSFMGDGIMAVFGAPLDQGDHADRALAAAREMAGPRLSGFNAWIGEAGIGDGFAIGIGLNSGEVMTGQVGSERRVEYAAIGDTTNTAARLEAMTKDFEHSIFVSGSCRALLADDAGLVFVERLEVRGRSEPIEVWADAGGAAS